MGWHPAFILNKPMRRIFSISLILLFWLGPLAVLLPGGDDANLPLCCRRHGAHHCMGMTESPVGSPAIAAPSRCPLFPTATAVTVAPLFALTSSSIDLHTLAVQLVPIAHSRQTGFSTAIRTIGNRGPPTRA